MTSTLRRTLHWGPIVALAIIFYISYATILACLHGWPPIESRNMFDSSRVIKKGDTQSQQQYQQPMMRTVYSFSWTGFVRLTVFLLMLAQILINYFLASGKGPGYVPDNWKPEIPFLDDHLQLCPICETYKAPRSHHCRTCNRCILKMDHHCPWINNCVGINNQRNFVLFLSWVVLTGLYTIFVLMDWLVVLFGNFHLFKTYYYDVLICIFAVCLAIGVVIAVGFLDYHQIGSILRNMTDIEEWIMEKAVARKASENQPPISFPYKLSKTENWQQIMGKGVLQLFWPWYTHSVVDEQFKKYPGRLPTNPSKPLIQLPSKLSDAGLWWPVVGETAHQYTFTQEQVLQKREKLSHSQLVTVQREYSGWCWGYKIGGWRLMYAFPSCEDTQLAVNPQDVVLILRAHKGWLYGENQGPEETSTSTASTSTSTSTSGKKSKKKEMLKGWFPEYCVDLKEN